MIAGDIDDTEEYEDYNDNDYEIEIPTYYRKQLQENETASGELDLSDDNNAPKKSRILQTMLNSSDVASALDRINLSDRKFTILAAAIAKADGQNLEDGTLSRSTVKRKRATHRETIDKTVCEEFRFTEKSPLVLHWDSKLMKDRTNKMNRKVTVDRLPVLVTGYGINKILGVAKLSSGTGEAYTSNIYRIRHNYMHPMAQLRVA